MSYVVGGAAVLALLSLLLLLKTKIGQFEKGKLYSVKIYKSTLFYEGST
jgi:hypothetical protein